MIIVYNSNSLEATIKKIMGRTHLMAFLKNYPINLVVELRCQSRVSTMVMVLSTKLFAYYMFSWVFIKVLLLFVKG